MSKRWQNFLLDVLMYILIGGICFLSWYCLTACSPRVITVPEYHTEYIVKTDTFVSRDSIHHYDSVMVKMAGDTVTVEHWTVIYKDRWREKVVSDTILRCDSIRVPYPVEKKLSRWQNLCISFGGYAFGIAIALALLLIILMYYRWKKL